MTCDPRQGASGGRVFVGLARGSEEPRHTRRPHAFAPQRLRLLGLLSFSAIRNRPSRELFQSGYGISDLNSKKRAGEREKKKHLEPSRPSIADPAAIWTVPPFTAPVTGREKNPSLPYLPTSLTPTPLPPPPSLLRHLQGPH